MLWIRARRGMLVSCLAVQKSGSRYKTIRSASVELKNLFTKYDQCRCSNGLRVINLSFMVHFYGRKNGRKARHLIWCDANKTGGVQWKIHVRSPLNYFIGGRIKIFRPINNVVGNIACSEIISSLPPLFPRQNRITVTCCQIKNCSTQNISATENVAIADTEERAWLYKNFPRSYFRLWSLMGEA